MYSTFKLLQLQLERSSQLRVQHTGPDINSVGAFWLDPHLARSVPRGYVLPPQMELCANRMIGLDLQFLEPPKSLRLGARDLEIQLCHLGRDDRADVGDLCGDCGDLVEDAGRVRRGPRRIYVDRQVRVCEAGVRQAVAELVAWGHVACEEAAVVDVHTLCEVACGTNQSASVKILAVCGTHIEDRSRCKRQCSR